MGWADLSCNPVSAFGISKAAVYLSEKKRPQTVYSTQKRRKWSFIVSTCPLWIKYNNGV